jgi:predicted PurR-regulated permease PerM
VASGDEGWAAESAWYKSLVTATPVARWLYPTAGVLAAGAVLYALRGVLTPVLFAFLLAYVLNPVVDRLEALGVPRAAGIVFILGAALGGIAFFLVLVLPTIARDLATLVQTVPALLERVRAVAEPVLRDFGLEVPRGVEDVREVLPDDYRALAAGAVGPLRAVVKGVLGGTASALGAFFSALLVPILAFYLLLDFARIVAVARDLVPMRQRANAIAIGREVDEVLAQFLRGQLTVMVILALLYAVGYAFVGVPLAVPIGILAGLVSFIPYVGGAIALGLGLTMVALHWDGWGPLAGVVIVYASVQALEGLIITPRVVGDKLGLAPIWILLALMAGGELFGFLGVMLALPVAAVVKVFVLRAHAAYRASTVYAEAPVEASAPMLRLRPRRAARRRRKGRV